MVQIRRCVELLIHPRAALTTDRHGDLKVEARQIRRRLAAVGLRHAGLGRELRRDEGGERDVYCRAEVVRLVRAELRDFQYEVAYALDAKESQHDAAAILANGVFGVQRGRRAQRWRRWRECMRGAQQICSDHAHDTSAKHLRLKSSPACRQSLL